MLRHAIFDSFVQNFACIEFQCQPAAAAGSALSGFHVIRSDTEMATSIRRHSGSHWNDCVAEQEQ